MANFYLVSTREGTEEVTADFYERKGEHWAFVLGGDTIYSIKIDDVVSIAKAPTDLHSDSESPGPELAL